MSGKAFDVINGVNATTDGDPWPKLAEATGVSEGVAFTGYFEVDRTEMCIIGDETTTVSHIPPYKTHLVIERFE